MDVFISHAHEDRDVAKILASDLRKGGITVWLASEILKPGDKWLPELLNAIHESPNFIALVSKNAAKSSYFSSELAAAIASADRSSESRNIIPVLIEPTADLPPFLNQYQAIDASISYSDAVKYLIQIIKSGSAKKDKSNGAREASVLEDLETTQKILRAASEVRLDEIYVNQRNAYRSFIALGVLLSVVSSMVIVLSLKKSEDLSVIFSTVIPLISAVIGYYFGGRAAETRRAGPLEGGSDRHRRSATVNKNENGGPVDRHHR